MNRVLASELLEVFPAEELTAMATPEPHETITEFCRRVGYDLGLNEDGVAIFLLNELADLDRDEAIGYLDDMVSDLLEVRHQITASVL